MLYQVGRYPMCPYHVQIKKSWFIDGSKNEVNAVFHYVAVACKEVPTYKRFIATIMGVGVQK